MQRPGMPLRAAPPGPWSKHQAGLPVQLTGCDPEGRTCHGGRCGQVQLQQRRRQRRDRRRWLRRVLLAQAVHLRHPHEQWPCTAYGASGWPHPRMPRGAQATTAASHSSSPAAVRCWHVTAPPPPIKRWDVQAGRRLPARGHLRPEAEWQGVRRGQAGCKGVLQHALAHMVRVRARLPLVHSLQQAALPTQHPSLRAVRG